MRQARYELDRQTMRDMAANGATASEIAQRLGRSTQGIRNLALKMGISFNESKAAAGGGACKQVCAGGSACCLRGDVSHTWHICKASNCTCHDLKRTKEAQP